jgi:hypothetical protein
MFIVLEGAVINNVAIPKWQVIGRAACGKQQLIVGIFITGVIQRVFFRRVQLGDTTAEVQFRASLGRFAPDLFYRTALP